MTGREWGWRLVAGIDAFLIKKPDHEETGGSQESKAGCWVVKVNVDGTCGRFLYIFV